MYATELHSVLNSAALCVFLCETLRLPFPFSPQCYTVFGAVLHGVFTLWFSAISSAKLCGYPSLFHHSVTQCSPQCCTEFLLCGSLRFPLCDPDCCASGWLPFPDDCLFRLPGFETHPPCPFPIPTKLQPGQGRGDVFIRIFQ